MSCAMASFCAFRLTADTRLNQMSIPSPRKEYVVCRARVSLFYYIPNLKTSLFFIPERKKSISEGYDGQIFPSPLHISVPTNNS